jgi:hypothetical protein
VAETLRVGRRPTTFSARALGVRSNGFNVVVGCAFFFSASWVLFFAHRASKFGTPGLTLGLKVSCGL